MAFKVTMMMMMMNDLCSIQCVSWGTGIRGLMRGMTTLPKVTGTISGQRQIPKVGLHQGSVLSPLLFVIVMEMISRQLQAAPPELLYADNLILMTESEESLRDEIVKWKSGLEAKGLKMNTGKTKVMFICSTKDKMEEKGKFPCGVCKRELAIIQFCDMVASGFIQDVVE